MEGGGYDQAILEIEMMQTIKCPFVISVYEGFEFKNVDNNIFLVIVMDVASGDLTKL